MSGQAPRVLVAHPGTQHAQQTAYRRRVVATVFDTYAAARGAQLAGAVR